MSIRPFATLLGLASLVGLAFGFGYVSYPLLHTPVEPVTTSQDVTSTEQNMPVYWDVWRLLELDFYGPKPDATTRTYGAIRGMVATFDDPYTYFVEPKPRELERDNLAGKFGGIGANIELTPEGYVLRPVRGQPAALAGVQDGDLLLLVDDQEVTSAMSADDVAALVRGPVGSEVTLVVRRSDSGEEVTLTIVRAEIQLPSVEWRMLEAGAGEHVGYIRHTLFTERSVDEMQQALTELHAQGAARYIYDLRGNPGGLVSAAVAVADLWLDDGVIFIEQKASGAETAQSATAGTAAGDAPLVVMVDGGSASASEIVAGALQDHGRAMLVGEKTYGKGSVQLIHELADQSSIHITNAQWLTPNRHRISENGLLPDVPVAQGEDPLAAAVAAVEAASVAQAPTATP